jgi:hypothetical protein
VPFRYNTNFTTPWIWNFFKMQLPVQKAKI